MIARGHQENRICARHDNRVQNRFVAVAIDNDNIARRDVGMPHHFVGGRRAVRYEKTMIRIENARGIALRSTDRTVMVQQLAELFHRVANVGTQHVLAKKLVKHLPDR